jgi:hypothetical protein
VQWEGQWKFWPEKNLVLRFRVSVMICGKRTDGGIDFGKLARSGITWNFADSTVREWKCLLAKECEHYSSIFTAIDVFNLVTKPGQMHQRAKRRRQ